MELQLDTPASVSAPSVENLNDLTCTNMTNETWASDVIEDPDSDDVYIELPDELLALQGWGEGTRLKWTVNPDNTVTLSEVE